MDAISNNIISFDQHILGILEKYEVIMKWLKVI